MEDVLYKIAYVVSALFEVFIVYVFFKNVLKKSKLSKKGTIIVYAIFAIMNILAILFLDEQLIVLLSFFILTTLVSLIYDCKKSVQIISLVVAILVISISEIIMGLILSSLLKISVGEIIDNIIYYSTGMLTSKFLSFLLVKIIGSNYNPNDNPLGSKLVISFLVLPVVSLFVGVVIIGAFGKNISSFMAIIGTVSIVALTGANLLVFHLFEKYSFQFKARSIMEREKEKAEQEKIYLEELIERQNSSNKVMHDLKNKLFAIRTMCENGRSEALDIINDICDTVMTKESIMYTRNEAIDALINSKRSKIENNDIIFKCNCYVVSFENIAVIDICAILGNLLDNAIEACLKMEGKKAIQVDIRQVNSCLIIEVSNPVMEKVEIIEGKIQTTKENKSMHGLGLKNIAEITKKYGGTVALECSDELFKASVILLESAS